MRYSYRSLDSLTFALSDMDAGSRQKVAPARTLWATLKPQDNESRAAPHHYKRELHISGQIHSTVLTDAGWCS
jgi:hypothetical protein